MEQHFRSWARTVPLAMMGLLVAVTGASAGIIGDTVDVTEVFQGFAPAPTVVDLGRVVVGPNIEYPFNFGPNYTNIDFVANSLAFSMPAGTWTYFPTPGSPTESPFFADYVITDLTHSFTSASVDPATNAPGFVASDFSFSNGTITLDMTGVELVGPGVPPGSPGAVGPSPSEVRLELNLAVPEPSSVVIFGSALLALGRIARRKKSSSPAASRAAPGW